MYLFTFHVLTIIPTYLFWLNFAFVRTAQHAGHVPPHLDVLTARHVTHHLELLQRLLDRAVDVALGETLRGCAEHGHFLYA